MKTGRKTSSKRKARNKRIRRLVRDGKPLGSRDAAAYRSMCRSHAGAVNPRPKKKETVIRARSSEQPLPAPAREPADKPAAPPKPTGEHQTYTTMAAPKPEEHFTKVGEPDQGPVSPAEVAEAKGWKRDKNGKWREKGKFVSRVRLAEVGLAID